MRRVATSHRQSIVALAPARPGGGTPAQPRLQVPLADCAVGAHGTQMGTGTPRAMSATKRRVIAAGGDAGALEAMRGHGREHRLHVLGQRQVAAGEQRPGARRAHQSLAGARRQAERMSLRWRVLASSDCTYSSKRGATCTRCAAACSSRTASGFERRRHAGQQVAPVALGQQRAFVRGVGITQRDAHQEAVELRLGQPERAELLERILRGDHEERIGQRGRW